MRNFFDSIIIPLVKILRPENILEIGSASGKNSQYILETTEGESCVLHVIDPVPSYDPKALGAMHPGRMIHYNDLSLKVLEKIPHCELVLIDGDHNWYTVYNELKLLMNISGTAGRPFPMTLLHDVAWPYGRRDLYYNPSNIPSEFRNPYKQLGMLPGRNDLIKGGRNNSAHNALFENGPRNGVLTGIEDFIAEHPDQFDFFTIPVLWGLGVLVPRASRQENQDLDEFLKKITPSEELRKVMERVEHVRVVENLGKIDEAQKLKKSL